MLTFGERVRNSITEQLEIIPGKINVPSYEELCHIFNIDKKLTEDKANNEAWIYLACSYYKMLMGKIKVHDYTKTTSGAYEINLDNLNVYVSTGNDGTYNHTQPTELLADKVSVCDFMIKLIEDNLRSTLHKEDLLTTEALTTRINNVIHVITSNPGFIYHEFFAALSNDPKAFVDFYTEIVDTCIDYVQHNLKECNIYAIYNALVESLLRL